MDLFRLLARGASIGTKQKKDLEAFQAKPPQESRSTDFFGQLGKPSASTEVHTTEEASEFRGANKIRITGDAPPPLVSFKEMESKLDATLLRNLVHYDFVRPTPVQCEAIPALLDRNDLVACAPTGSGKTIAFVTPLLEMLLKGWDRKKHQTRAIIISPTRELAAQIYQVSCELSRNTNLSVGVLSKSMIGKLKNNNAGSKQILDLVVATPMRLLEAARAGLIDVSDVKYFILDEADRLLSEGFVQQTDEIVALLPERGVTKAIFSATLPSNVEELATSIMSRPLRVIIGHKEAAAQTIDQELKYCGNEFGKLTALRQMLVNGSLTPPVLVFVQSVLRAKALFHELIYDKMNVDVIHSELTQSQREKAINSFKQGEVWVLICTDVLARGIDFAGVNAVINYDIPLTAQAYVHRIGRTGRAGRTGKAITFFSKEDTNGLKPVVNVMRQSGYDVGDWLVASTGRSKIPQKRASISTKPRAFKRRQA